MVLEAWTIPARKQGREEGDSPENCQRYQTGIAFIQICLWVGENTLALQT